MSRTFVQLVGAVENRLVDGDGTGTHAGVRWPLQEKKDALNLVLLGFARDTEVLQGFITFVQDAGAVYKPASSARVLRLLGHPQSATAGRRLAPTDEDALFDLSTTWETETGASSRYVWPYAIVGDLKKMRVHPFPAPADAWVAATAYEVGDYVVNGSHTYVCDTAGTSAGSGGPTGTGTNITDGTARWDWYSDSTSIAYADLKARAVYADADLVNTTDVSNIPGEYHHGIVDGACAYLLGKVGQAANIDLKRECEATYAQTVMAAKNSAGFNSAIVDYPTERF